MDIIYCSRCNRAVPPGGADEGRYFKLGEEIVCPKCYRQIKPHEHTGDTVPIEPLKEDNLLSASRLIPAAASRSARPPTTRLGPAVRSPRKTSTRVMSAVRSPSSHLISAARRPSKKGSARIRAAGSSSAAMRLILAFVLLTILAAVLTVVIIVFLRDRNKNPTGGGNGAPRGTGGRVSAAAEGGVG